MDSKKIAMLQYKVYEWMIVLETWNKVLTRLEMEGKTKGHDYRDAFDSWSGLQGKLSAARLFALILEIELDFDGLKEVRAA